MQYFRNVWKDRHIIWALVRQDVVNRYRGSLLGVLWALLMPLGVTLIIASIYTVLWQADVRYFVPYLFSGLTPWNFIVECSAAGASAYLNAEGYIKQLPVDLEIFPIRAAMSSFVTMMFGILAYFLVIAVLNPAYFTLWSLMTIPALLVFFLLGATMSTIAATAQAYIRDYAPMQSLIFQGLFYVTPILYDHSMMRERGFSFVYEYNPFFYFIQILRDALMGQPAQGRLWLGALVILAAALGFALWLFQRTRRRIAFKL